MSGRASASEPASSELDGCQISLQKGNKGKRMFEGRTMGEGKEGKCRKDKNSPDDDPFFLQSLISVCQRVSGFGFGSLGLERKNGTTNGCCVSRGCLWPDSHNLTVRWCHISLCRTTIIKIEVKLLPPTVLFSLFVWEGKLRKGQK